MAKIVNYPRKSFETALEIATTVAKLGGKCNEQTLADKLSKKVSSGSFADDVNSSIKHELVTKDKQIIKVTPLYSEIQLAYSDNEKIISLRKAFFAPSTYKEIFERFNRQAIPIDVLDKILIREYDVNPSISKTVANNIIKGGESLGIIKDNIVQLEDEPIEAKKTDEKVINNDEDDIIKQDENSGNTVAGIKIKDKKINIDSIQKEVVININIQLTVPETTDEEVYEKFFSAMKRNLLS